MPEYLILGASGIVGVVSNIAGRFMEKRHEIAMANLQMQHEIAMANLRIAEHKQIAKLDTKIASRYLKLREQQEREQQEVAEQAVTYPWVNTVHSLFRPFLTLVCIVCAVAGEAYGLGNATLFSNLSSTAVCWWFSEYAVSMTKNK